MRKLGLLVAVLMVLGLAMSASAQEENRFSVYGGYYFVHTSVNVSGGSETSDDAVLPQAITENQNFGFNFNGGGGQFAYNFNQDRKIKYGLVAEFAGATSSDFGITTNVFTYLFGPRLSFGSGRLTPFVQVLVGGARASGAFANEGVSQNAFALTTGGGLDFQLTKHWFVRPVQASYLMTRFSIDAANHTQNSFQYSAGLGFRWP